MGTPTPIPRGTHTVTPHLVLRDCAGALAFYQRAFGAKEEVRLPSPDGRRIWHAEIRIGDSLVYLNDEVPGALAPWPAAPGAMSIQLYVEDCDAVYASAVRAGAHPTMRLEDRFWGDRMGIVTDPFGCQWTISTHRRHVSREELDGALATLPTSSTTALEGQAAWEPDDDALEDPFR